MGWSKSPSPSYSRRSRSPVNRRRSSRRSRRDPSRSPYSSRRKSRSGTPHRRRSRSPATRRKRSRSPTTRRHRRRRSHSSSESLIPKSRSPSLTSTDRKSAAEKLKIEEEKKS
ncbi:hypothetical protein AABB24_030498 [Solanum stoloniferum]|uniref:Uncharacterized protein n=1 Tax=Solanum stoloniferum TaxID=62892 RepID=A0ABD2S432_9SOLN